MTRYRLFRARLIFFLRQTWVWIWGRQRLTVLDDLPPPEPEEHPVFKRGDLVEALGVYAPRTPPERQWRRAYILGCYRPSGDRWIMRVRFIESTRADVMTEECIRQLSIVDRLSELA